MAPRSWKPADARRRPRLTCGRGARALLLLVAVAASAHVPAERPAPLRHTALVAAYPAADTLHRMEIVEIRLRFSTAVQPALSTIRLRGPAGTPSQVGALASVPGSNASEIHVRFAAPLPSGDYVVEWRTAGPDSHPITGSYAFAVELPRSAEAPLAAEGADTASLHVPLPGVTSASSGAAASPRAAGGLAVRTLFYLSVLGMLGTAVFRLGVVAPLARDPLLSDTAVAAAARTQALAWGVVALGALALPARLARQSLDLFGEAAFAPGNLGRLLFGSGWGGAWWLQLGMVALFVAGLLRVRGREDRTGGWWVMLAAAAGMALVPALSGHAAGSPENVRAFAVLNDAVHVVAAGAWAGTLAVLLLAGVGAAAARSVAVPAPAGGAWSAEEGLLDPEGADGELHAGGALPPLARLVNAFSRLALLSVAVLIATGAVSSWLQVGSPSALLSSSYGRTLLLKLALVAGAAALGFYNWRVVRPSLANAPRAELIRIPATVEMLLAVGIVVVTALLVVTPLP